MYQGFILHGQNGIKFRSTYKKYNWGFETIECETEPGSTDVVNWYISKTHAIDQSKEVNICMWGKLICSVHTDPSHQLLKLAVKFTVVPNIYLYIQQWLTIRPLPPHKTLLQFFFFLLSTFHSSLIQIRVAFRLSLLWFISNILDTQAPPCQGHLFIKHVRLYRVCSRLNLADHLWPRASGLALVSLTFSRRHGGGVPPFSVQRYQLRQDLPHHLSNSIGHFQFQHC